MTAPVLTEQTDHVLRVTINRPEVMNAIDQHVARGLAAAIKAAEADRDIRVVVLTGAGDRAFSAGGDVSIEDEATFPIPATLVGVPVHVTGIDFDGNERRGLIATIERNGHTTTISVLDIELPGSERATAQLIAAYKRWLGIT